MVANIENLLEELENKLARLRIRYEQYLIGVEKFEPVKERAEVARDIRNLQQQVFSRTAHRFRLHGLIQRFTSFQHYWNRCQRQIEEGTFKRDLARIQREMKRKGIEDVGLMKARTAAQVEAALTRGFEQAAGGATARAGDGAVPGADGAVAKAGAAGPSPDGPRHSAANVRGSAPPKGPAPQDAGLRRLYDAFVAARRKTGESLDGLTFDKMAATIRKQVGQIRKAHQCKEVQFTVEVKGGRAVLKAVPKK